jgi:parallel beta-helix repeat protein
MKTKWGGFFENSVLVLRMLRAISGTMVVILGLFGTVMIVHPPQVAATTRHVPRDYPTIQAAISASGGTNGTDEIVLDIGIYYEGIDFLGKAITVRSTDPNDPSVVAATIIDGNQWDKAVAFTHGEGKDSVLSGVTVQKVNANLSYGGIYCSGSSPTISKCIVSLNQGGGIDCSDSSATIDNCTITGNGDGIACWKSSLIVTGCFISKNLCSGIYCGEKSLLILTNCSLMENLSSGMSFVDSTAAVRDCKISGNNSASGANGGGICCLSNSSPAIVNCLITGNSSCAGGGILCDWDCSPVINGCTITDNSASKAGGGILCSGNASPLVVNCIIARNSVSDGSGGGIYSDGAGVVFPYPLTQGLPALLAIPKPVIMNCTITQNSASRFGGGICSFFSLPTITNCILWGDLPQEVTGEVKSITYSDIQTGHFGHGNTRDDPLFIAPETGDYHLQPGSPCINNGTSHGAPSEDIDGYSRDMRPDMGVYEYTLAPTTPSRGGWHRGFRNR